MPLAWRERQRRVRTGHRAIMCSLVDVKVNHHKQQYLYTQDLKDFHITLH